MAESVSSVLVVDDNAENRVLLSSLLKPHHKVVVATSGQQALSICQKQAPDIVLLDIMMPEMDGYEVCEKLKANPKTQHIPVIFLTAKTQIEDEQRGFEVGAVDYILKPISPPTLLSRINTHLKLRFTMEELSEQNDHLEERVRKRTRELEMLQDATIGAMASLAETRDNETGNHIRRTQNYVKLLAEELLLNGYYTDELNPESIELLYKSAPLHDIGKVGIPDSVLLKPGKLTDEEFQLMKFHTTLGRAVLLTVEDSIDFKCDFLQTAKEIAYSHQEKWDGGGYPEGLSDYDIPLSARLMAVADVYDALISERVYKPAFSHDKAVSIIAEGAGTHFEPLLVDTFLAIEDKFREIASTFRDEGFDEDSFNQKASGDE
ncbi:MULTISPECIES: response regulator [Vibrio]|uniref:Two-component system response regulator n=1 Tax=Vibrio bivalvicida TaxID=1276888 RepID=A0A177XW06_9VIBR|nr:MULTISPECIES: two-component system response regulator [Vibrio]KLN66589.1 chemotaxis protein CheY [Vibrio sp. VPAP30]OAJ92767.1 two-component system response regulator [Vibrio bivalvicida]